MNKILNFYSWNLLNENINSDLGKVYIFTHSDSFSFSHLSASVRSAAGMMFQFLTPPGVFHESIVKGQPIYNYGNYEELRQLIKDGHIDKNDVYNDPARLIFANSKIEFHKKVAKLDFVPKTVFTKEDAQKLKFPVIGKPSEGSKSQGITVFKNKEEVTDNKKETTDKVKIDAFAEGPVDTERQGPDEMPLDIFSEKFDLKKEFRVLTLRGKVLYTAERIPTNSKAKSLRESKDIFDGPGSLDKRSSFDWKPCKPLDGFEDICKKTCEALGLDIIGVDIAVDGKGKLFLIEANTCPGLNKDQVVILYAAIFEDYYGRVPNEAAQKVMKELSDALKSEKGFSSSASMGRKVNYGMENGVTAKFDIERSFGSSLKQIKKDHGMEVSEGEKAEDDVRAAAKRAGYNIGPVYHGTNEKFTVFDKEKSNFRFDKDQMLFFFAFDKESARRRGGTLDPVKHIKKCYLMCKKRGDYDDDDNLTPADADYVLLDDFMVSVKRPEQIKLADAVTYDDDGKPIPLSKRFDHKNKDIRY